MQILIIGAGDVGFQLAKRLTREQHDITLVDADPFKVRRASEQLDARVIEGSGSSLQVLRQAGVTDADVLAAVSNDDGVNLMACRLAKALGVEVTIARLGNPEYTQPGFVLTPEDLGVDHMIQPEREAADAIVRLLQESSATHVVDLENGRVELIGLILEEDSPLIGAPLTELGRRYNYPPLQLVAVDRNHVTIIPKGKDVLMAGDHLFAICDPSYAKTFFGLAGKHKKPRIDNIMIMGGGRVARFVAEAMAEMARVKIIEQDLTRAERLADLLPRALILHGDGTDLELLEEESIKQMDSFVAVTGDDENNIIATLLAKQFDVKRPVVLVNKVEYMRILPSIGINTAISKQMLTVNAVLQFIQHRQLAAIASIPGIEGQLIEYIARRGSRITQKQIKDVHFPHSAVIGAILRNGKLIIPDGLTRVEAEDRTVVFAMPAAMSDLDRLFGG
jgi:trk system potassium uptake protein TrkA